MGKELRFGPAQPGKPVPGALGPMDEPLEFAARPANDIEIDPFESGTQLRPVKRAVPSSICTGAFSQRSM